jgi:hypothetical protein
MSPVDYNIDVMRYIVVFLLLSFGIISCNSYAHLENTEGIYLVLLHHNQKN